MLFFLHNGIERTFVVTAAGICTFWPGKKQGISVWAYYKKTALFLDG